MKKILWFFILSISILPIRAQYYTPFHAPFTDTTRHAKPLKALLFSQIPNLAIWSINRCVVHADFSFISFQSIGRNFQSGLLWDNDKMMTNLFAHPFHGSLYFNAARANGLSFWESYPYALFGSFIWEFFGENEPPSINDLMATSIGGMAIGEMTYRVSNALFDDSDRGISRVFREIAGTLISPMNGLIRMINGSMFSVRKRHFVEDWRRFPISYSAGTGIRFFSKRQPGLSKPGIPYLQLSFNYGDPFSPATFKPYQYFRWNFLFNLSNKQPLIGQFNLLGILWGKAEDNLLWGFFQHFNYYETAKFINEERPFFMAETAAAGLGLISRHQSRHIPLSIETSGHISGVLLGASQSDYYRVIDRDYNFGSGYSLKFYIQMQYDQIRLRSGLEHYQLFTWQEPRYFLNERLQNPLFLNSQGNRGNSSNTHWTSSLEVSPYKGMTFYAGLSLYKRYTYYQYYPDVSTLFYAYDFGLKYIF